MSDERKYKVNDILRKKLSNFIDYLWQCIAEIELGESETVTIGKREVDLDGVYAFKKDEYFF